VDLVPRNCPVQSLHYFFGDRNSGDCASTYLAWYSGHCHITLLLWLVSEDWLNLHDPSNL
jgi:hypothetical protein